MNVLLFGIGSAGDVHPLLALAVALRGRGHRATVVTNGHFAPVVHRLGLEYEELGTDEDYLTTVQDPELWKPIAGFKKVVAKAFLEPMRPSYALIQARNVPGETVVVAPTTAFGARIAREELGVPLVSVLLQPAVLRSLTQPPTIGPLPLRAGGPRLWNRALYWWADRSAIDPLLAPTTNAFRAELGLPPVRRLLQSWWFSPDLVLGLFPDWFAPPQPDWPGNVHLTGFPLYDESDTTPLAPEVRASLDAGPPPVVFTPGSAMAHGAAFFEAGAAACRQLGRRALFISPFHDRLPSPLPDHVRHFDSVPFSHLFPRAAAVVHHGGIGTAAQGLAAGVPQLIMPMAHDQPDNADRLVRLGVARSLSPRRFQAPAVARALAALLDTPEPRSLARQLAQRLQPGKAIADSCILIERALTRRPASAFRT